MYRVGAMLLAASLLIGCSKDSAEKSAKTLPTKGENQAVEKVVEKKEQEESELTSEEIAAAASSAFVKLQADSRKSEAEFMQKVQSAPREQQMELFQSGGERKQFAAKFLEWAKKYPDSADEFTAIQFASEKGDETVADEAIKLINSKFINDDRLLGLLNRYGMGAPPEQKNEDFLQNLIDNSTNPAVKGSAIYSLAKMLQTVSEAKGMMADQPEMKKMLPQASVEFIGKDFGDLNPKLEAMFTDIVDNFGDVKLGNKVLGELAGDELFVFKYLSVGKVAPEIDGVDLDDKPFKLSDYRGKVVMLDFWGDW
ncbi:MAG: hypothetical protein P8R31_19610 [Mariniblastus sp.]|nr:hypothetical protein [Mariniblastus sp.]